MSDHTRAPRRRPSCTPERSREIREARAQGPTRLGVLKLLEKLARSAKTPPRVALQAMTALLEVLPAASILAPKEEGKPSSPWLRPKAVDTPPAPAQDTNAA